jgi:site-specific recombinase XerD
VAAVSGLHQWLAKSGYLPWNVWTAVQRLTPSPAKFAQRSLSDDEWESVETYLEGWPLSPVKVRAHAVLAMARYCGLRCSEIAALKGKSFQALSSPKKAVDVIWVVGKGDAERYVPLSGVAAEYLNAYLQMRGIPSYRTMDPEESVFLSLPEGYIRGAFEANQPLSDKGIYRIVKGVMEKVANDSMDHEKANRLRNVSTHWLRHTFATTVAKKADIKTVQELLGHKSIQTTSLYIHKNLDEKIQAINDAFEKQKI